VGREQLLPEIRMRRIATGFAAEAGSVKVATARTV
jgi:hypothetical protein